MMFTRLLADMQTSLNGSGLPGFGTPNTDNAELQVILGVFFGIIGGMAVLMIVINGLRYVLAGGSPDKVASARKGIIYALVGLAVALVAEGLVAWVAQQL